MHVYRFQQQEISEMTTDDWWYLDIDGVMRYSRDVKKGEALYVSEMGLFIMEEQFKRQLEEQEVERKVLELMADVLFDNDIEYNLAFNLARWQIEILEKHNFEVRDVNKGNRQACNCDRCRNRCEHI